MKSRHFFHFYAMRHSRIVFVAGPLQTFWTILKTYISPSSAYFYNFTNLGTTEKFTTVITLWMIGSSLRKFWCKYRSIFGIYFAILLYFSGTKWTFGSGNYSSELQSPMQCTSVGTGHFWGCPERFRQTVTESSNPVGKDSTGWTGSAMAVGRRAWKVFQLRNIYSQIETETEVLRVEFFRKRFSDVCIVWNCSVRIVWNRPWPVGRVDEPLRSVKSATLCWIGIPSHSLHRIRCK